MKPLTLYCLNTSFHRTQKLSCHNHKAGLLTFSLSIARTLRSELATGSSGCDRQPGATNRNSGLLQYIKNTAQNAQNCKL